MSNFDNRIDKLESSGGGRKRVEIVPVCLSEIEANAYCEDFAPRNGDSEKVIFVQTGVPRPEDDERTEKFRQDRKKQ